MIWRHAGRLAGLHAGPVVTEPSLKSQVQREVRYMTYPRAERICAVTSSPPAPAWEDTRDFGISRNVCCLDIACCRKTFVVLGLVRLWRAEAPLSTRSAFPRLWRTGVQDAGLHVQTRIYALACCVARCSYPDSIPPLLLVNSICNHLITTTYPMESDKTQCMYTAALSSVCLHPT